MAIRKILVLFIFSSTLFTSAHPQDITFHNPLAEQRADPWVIKADDGTYYLIATVPEYNRIVIGKPSVLGHVHNRCLQSIDIGTGRLWQIGECSSVK